ncbi:SNF1-interacting protein [Alternaria viburni]|uniref:SNF1-interacting protein n=1 Tax=Alternaria viburni TaxID=566460 RepID=UPI0020C3C36D|nr:SNF1-interacting protein [Alternaria viburni]KAI4664626.1 SNF1-interacting protein [Alternaria viburni]
MGNSQGKEATPERRGHARRSSAHQPTSPSTAGPAASTHDRPGNSPYGNSRRDRGSRPDLSFLGIRTGDNAERDPALEPRRETKAEREARKLEKDRILRAQERERSLKEEGVDGGYLVTLGVYTGPEDFSKPTVRQLQIERRLAPFWRGLDDHEDTWTEHQLVEVVNGRPLPAADDIPPEEPPRVTTNNHLSTAWNPRSSEPSLNKLTVPMGARSMSQEPERGGGLSPSNPTFSLPSPGSPIANNSSSSPFFRGRAKTLASLATGSRNASQSDMAPQELHLPKDPYVNGQRVEAFLYKNASECPICFMYYPPHLNKTRCCDQPICSECFVQIKRPDPHPPEHHGEPGAEGAQSAEPEEEVQLVSEAAACPYCTQTEFGVTYEPPPFRRGLVYNGQGHNGMGSATSAMSSTSSLNSPTAAGPGRRRATSLAVTDKTVITTDMVRPDWAKKLADAKSHALRRAAAATALHNAAYMMGNLPQGESRFGLGRRRRIFTTDSAGSSGHGTPRREGESSSGQPGNSGDLYPSRISSRRGNRIDDLEELMMMEAIRLSLAAEEDRKKREEKDAAKEAKKEGKKKAKEIKKVAKAQRNIGSGFHPIEIDGIDETEAGSSSAAGKGKGVDRSGGAGGFNPMSEPTSTLNTPATKDDPQKHLEVSRAQIQREKSDTSNPAPSHLERNKSNASSSSSSFADSFQNSLQQQENQNLAPGSSYVPSSNASGISLAQGDTDTPPQDSNSTEPMFNFQSLTKAITPEDDNKNENKPQYIEDVGETHTEEKATTANGKAPEASTAVESQTSDPLAESTVTLRPSEETPKTQDAHSNDDDEISPAPPIQLVSDDHSPSHFDQKHLGEVSMMHELNHQATQ